MKSYIGGWFERTEKRRGEGGGCFGTRQFSRCLEWLPGVGRKNNPKETAAISLNGLEGSSASATILLILLAASISPPFLPGVKREKMGRS